MQWDRAKRPAKAKGWVILVTCRASSLGDIDDVGPFAVWADEEFEQRRVEGVLPLRRRRTF